MDYSRTDCIKSYFQILRELGEGTSATDVKFVVEGTNLLMAAKGGKRRLLCEKRLASMWLAYDFFSHHQFKMLVAKVGNENPQLIDITDVVKLVLFKLPAET
jgi:hypothetical protein